MNSHYNLQQALSSEMARAFEDIERAGPAGAEFARVVQKERMQDNMLREAGGILNEFVQLGYSGNSIITNVARGYLGIQLRTFMQRERGYYPSNVEGNFIYDAEALENEINKVSRQHQNSRSGFGGGGGYSNNNLPPTFDSRSNNTGRNEFSSNSNTFGAGGNLLSQVTNKNTPAPSNNTFSGFTPAPVNNLNPETKIDKRSIVVIQPMSSIPYCIKGKTTLVINENSIRIYDITEADRMKLDYFKHELNGAFLDALRRNGVLKPESHFEASSNMLTALSKPISGIEGVKEEMRRLNQAMVNGQVDKDIDLGILRSVKMSDVYEGGSVNEVVTTIMHELSNEGFNTSETFAEFTMERLIPLYAKPYEVELLATLSHAKNLIQCGDTLMKLKSHISPKVWFMLDQRLTDGMSNYLCSTLPLFVKLDSFVDDYIELNKLILKNFSDNNYNSETQIAVLTGLQTFIENIIGQFDEVEVTQTTETDVPNDALATAFNSTNQVTQHRAVNVVKEHYLMVGFNAANLRLTLPVLTDKNGTRKVFQPTGGVVDDLSMPDLHKSLSMFMQDKTEGQCFLLTNDHYVCRITRSLLNPTMFVLDLPVPAV